MALQGVVIDLSLLLLWLVKKKCSQRGVGTESGARVNFTFAFIINKVFLLSAWVVWLKSATKLSFSAIQRLTTQYRKMIFAWF